MRLLFLLMIPGVMGGGNTNRYQSGCIPARDCTVENVCYCGGNFDGWENGGGRKTGEFRTSTSANCAKNSRDCECADCGNWGGVEDVQCKEWRCDDDVGILDSNKICWHMLDSGVRVEKSYDAHFNCHHTKIACSTTVCDYGKYLTGCKRLNPGSCVDCLALADGRFWESKGSCVQKICSPIGPGKFLGKACTSTADAVILGCAVHPGNPSFVVPRQDGKATYYCPGGGLVLPLPENSEPILDYSDFACINGYYLNGASCVPCVPGSACRYGKRYVCPMHYYTSTFAMHTCVRCSSPTDCGSFSYPIRCSEGSTANVGCVSCGGCDYDPKRGLSCVTESYEMLGLPSPCELADVTGSVAVCK